MKIRIMLMIVCLTSCIQAQASQDIRAIIQNEENKSLGLLRDLEGSEASTVVDLKSNGLELLSDEKCLQMNIVAIDKSHDFLMQQINARVGEHACITVNVLKQILLAINNDLRYRGLVTTGFSGLQWNGEQIILEGVEGHVEQIIAPNAVMETFALNKHWQGRKFNILELDILMDRLSRLGDYVADVEPGANKGGTVIRISERQAGARSLTMGLDVSRRDANDSVSVDAKKADVFFGIDSVLLQHYTSPKGGGTGVELSSLNYDISLSKAWDLSMSYTTSSQSTHVDVPAQMSLRNRIERTEASAKLRSNLWARANRRWTIEMGLGKVTSANHFDEYELDIAREDRLVLSLSNELHYANPYANAKAVLNVRRGLDNSGRDSVFAGFERRNFTKLDLAVLGHVFTSSRGDAYVSGMLRLIDANENLPVDEALNIGGHSSVRGQASRAYSSHQGGFMRVAWNKRLPLQPLQGLWFSVGIDYGKGKRIGSNSSGQGLSATVVSASWSGNSLGIDVSAAIPMGKNNTSRRKPSLEGSLRYTF